MCSLLGVKYVNVSGESLETKRGYRESSEAGVTRNCEILDKGAGNQSLILWKIRRDLNLTVPINNLNVFFLFPQIRVILIVHQETSLWNKWKPLQKMITNQNAESSSPVLMNVSTKYSQNIYIRVS